MAGMVETGGGKQMNRFLRAQLRIETIISDSEEMNCNA
jgi:hypothetical protein